MKKVVLLTIIAIIIISTPHAFAQTNERNRGFYIDAGAGFGGVICSDVYEGVKPVFYLDLCVGWAVLQNLYIIIEGSSSGANSISGTINPSKAEEFGVFNHFIGPGIRFYPLPSKKHLQLGTNFGYCNSTVDSQFTLRDIIGGGPDIRGPSFENDPKLGFKLSLAYDFDSTMTGWALLLGGETMFTFISASPVIGFTVFAKVVFK